MIRFAYILAGGHSRRFGSDKARADRHGIPNIQHLANSIHAAGLLVTVVARKVNQYADLGLKTIPDLLPDKGPLIGLSTALAHALEQAGDVWIFVTTCDAGEFHPAWLDILDSQGPTDRLASLFQERPIQPFPGLYRSTAVHSILSFAKEENPSPTSWIRTIGSQCHFADCPDELKPHQFNTLDEWQQL